MATDETGRGRHSTIIISKIKFDQLLESAATAIQSKLRDELQYHLSTKEDQEEIDRLVTEIFDIWTASYRRILEISQEGQAFDEPEEKVGFFHRKSVPDEKESYVPREEPRRAPQRLPDRRPPQRRQDEEEREYRDYGDRGDTQTEVRRDQRRDRRY